MALSKSQKIPWRDVSLWDALTGELVTAPDRRKFLLQEYRRTGLMFGAFLANPALADENGEGPFGGNLWTAGPKVDEIDWEGFDA